MSIDIYYFILLTQKSKTHTYIYIFHLHLFFIKFVDKAGICSSGTMVDMTENDIENMIHLNIGSVTALSRLYGRDMKNQHRGRIMFVSSMTGAVPGGPGVAAYAATKAYEKSLSLSMGRELERHGVGVTCLMPGAVKGTSFAKASRWEDALCWKIPFYGMRAPRVGRFPNSICIKGNHFCFFFFSFFSCVKKKTKN